MGKYIGSLNGPSRRLMRSVRLRRMAIHLIIEIVHVVLRPTKIAHFLFSPTLDRFSSRISAFKLDLHEAQSIMGLKCFLLSLILLHKCFHSGCRGVLLRAPPQNYGRGHARGGRHAYFDAIPARRESASLMVDRLLHGPKAQQSFFAPVGLLVAAARL